MIHETSVFQYFEDDYLENNLGTIDNVITAYVGDYFSDTVQNQSTLSDEDLEDNGINKRSVKRKCINTYRNGCANSFRW